MCATIGDNNNHEPARERLKYRDFIFYEDYLETANKLPALERDKLLWKLMVYKTGGEMKITSEEIEELFESLLWLPGADTLNTWESITRKIKRGNFKK